MARYGIAVLVLVLILFGSPAMAQDYQVRWSVNGIGGGPASSTRYQARSTAGQTAVGRMGSPNFLALIGYWQGDVLTGIDEEPARPNIGSLVTGLRSPAPNPFRSRTLIRYSLAQEAEVLLQVYDPTGRQVKTLVSSARHPGRYTLSWNGTDDHGRLLANGIYFCRFKAGDYREVKKLLLTR